MNKIASLFAIPFSISVASLILIWYGLGLMACLTALLLVVLEVTLSFDNAVVNARVLSRMTATWQRRFLTWGMFIAVFFTRAILPILIVALSVQVSPLIIGRLIFESPDVYGELLDSARYAIYAFGGTFLMLVGLKYFFDVQKQTHWIHTIERYLSSWGRLEAVELFVSLAILGAVASLSPTHNATILFAGLSGVLLFLLAQGVMSVFRVQSSSSAQGGLALFLYLNILDAAFSLDSVVGAFALSNQIIVITVGLGIGAYCVRSLTMYMVHHGTLRSLVYIENGAHWAILGLAVVMFAGLFVDVPEPITGFVGLVFLGLAYWSSVKLVRS
jgi:hypothetical protein